MRIKNIELHNFGSYSGHNSFNFKADIPEERVVVIGGKNGAGKTTLFTAVQVCLYGNFAFGFKTAGKRYLSEIYNLINNQVRIDENGSAFVEIGFQQVDNTDLFDYVIRRAWSWPHNEICENLTVWKNGHPLEEEELLNFQNYLIHLIPPDMLKLYFFDGEKIADYFLGDKEVNVRDALMVLSGNDTFDILHDQVKRVLKIPENAQSGAAREYLAAQGEIEEYRQRVQELQNEIETIQESIEELTTEIERHKKEYSEHGGITIEEWTELHGKLKAEEEKRERLNWQRKLLATDLLPFAIVSELVVSVLPQLQAEKELQTYQALKRSLERDEFSAVLENTVCAMGSQNVKQDSRHLFESISNYLLDKTWENFSPLFGLSSDEEGQVQSVISRVNAFDPRVLIRYQKRIDNSLEKSKEIRARLQASSIENVESYMQTLSTLEEEVKIAILKKEYAQEILELKKSDLDQKESNLRNLKKAFEEQLKVHSVSAVSGKTLLLLEDLQNTLYSNLIQRVESDLNKKFQELIRKKNFFSRIYIDKSFTVHILRNEKINKIDLVSLLRTGSFSVATSALGDVAIAALRERYSVDSAIELRETLSAETVEQIILPVEISKDRLSSGEKQIFVMSLYWAIMNQSKNELPFIIDTPFARIDTEHRANITEYFFKKLTGQLLILSTDEELSNNHLEAMRDQISHVYMLEYGQDKRTHIRENQYFEV